MPDRKALLAALADSDREAASPQELGTTERRMEALRGAGYVIRHTVFNHADGHTTVFFKLTEKGRGD